MPRETYRVLHEDATLLVVDKAPGVLTVGHPGRPERCLLDDLRRDGHPVAPVHRLDRDTSGVLLLCLDKAWRAELEALFRKRDVAKEYLALIEGRPASGRATIDLPILDEGRTARVARGGRPAVTHYEVVEALPGAALVRLRPETGRHNQIRIHMAHIGHPLLGDRKFGRRGRSGMAKRTLLHAARLTFLHPADASPLDVSCDPPEDFATCLDELRRSRSSGRS